jgi:HEAT repeat protein
MSFFLCNALAEAHYQGGVEVDRPNIEKMKAQGDVEGLTKALKDRDWSVRREAAAALGDIGDAKAVEPLIQALKYEEKSPRLVTTAAWALSKIGAPTVDPLIRALEDKSKNVRLAAVWALGEIKDSRAVGPLTQMVEPLIQTLESRYLSVRGAAGGALKKIGGSKAAGPVVKALKYEDWDVRLAAAGALKQIRDSKAVEPLIQTLKGKGKDGDARLAAARALGEIRDPRAVEPLTQALKDEDSRVRKAAQEALEKLKGGN